MFQETEFPLLADRACGGCSVCCVHLTIEEPELMKPQGYRCPHLADAGGCGIYPSRPHTCRVYHCGWRRLKWVREVLRPDRSQVLVKLRSVGKGAEAVLAVDFLLLSKAALKAEGLAESIAAAVHSGVPVFLSIPGPPGYTSASARVDGELGAAVAARDKAEVLRILTELHEEGRVGKRAPIQVAKNAAGQPVIALGKPRRIGRGRLSRS